ncbi:Stealth CR1 domain-containing protein [Pseudobutyrivibrio xylanivorans]|uniref:Stealth protein CR2, conserved region 2 n=1 Tax=Pseudobutyrivibrio xylanivorans DSM 14809 TaxID=1123012 RepID=A0A1M6DAU5_PSEXY|nr:Stealth CR1 domain-containing protein [Pseudobutyrivibrio xylanivorans]SHI70168.1 Stealth protein CR2, conserved region 2 [Pseudobutyrivibrio xylanivorans DSM 14809]
MNQPIDIVIPWVDEKDIKWQHEKQKYESPKDFEASNMRFQSWDNLQLWFRAIEECMPWINDIYLITCGQIPEFLDENNPKLKIVFHTDFIPKEYLPTFNSNTIEMNIHRIPSLSENFILFSDDVFPLKKIEEEYYFKNNMVCDEAVENIITTSSFGAVSRNTRYAQVNNMFIINKYFKKREVQEKNRDKWYCEDYGDRLERTKACAYWYDFPGFYDPHMANAMKKSTLSKLWELEPEALDAGSRDRFRGHADVTQYLIRYWQICSGEFVPRRTQGKVFFPTIDTYHEVVEAIDNHLYTMISFNENCTPEEFERMKAAINGALERRYPNKCRFER